MVASPHGRKFLCYSCGCRFYDLNRPQALCPRCGADQSEAPEKPDIEDIAAKVLASTVTDTDEPGERYGPVADEMEVFDSEEIEGSTSRGFAKNAPSNDDDSDDGDMDADDNSFGDI
jgi:uncharacterized protein (TIGR02300 family)